MTCEWRQKVALYADDELAPAEQAEVAAHLRTCPECSAAAMEHMQLKKAVSIAGQRFTAPPDLRASVLAGSRRGSRSNPAWQWGLAMAASVLLVAGLVFFLRPRPSDPLLAELVDQHITTLASANPVDVVSTDRHTVKPWFQGRLPFSFNLPDLGGSAFTLLGGKMIYGGQDPGAELLYQVRQHKISVFILKSPAAGSSSAPPDRGLAFTVKQWDQGGLRFYLITDAPADDAGRLAAMFEEANRRQ